MLVQLVAALGLLSSALAGKEHRTTNDYLPLTQTSVPVTGVTGAAPTPVTTIVYTVSPAPAPISTGPVAVGTGGTAFSTGILSSSEAPYYSHNLSISYSVAPTYSTAAVSSAIADLTKLLPTTAISGTAYPTGAVSSALSVISELLPTQTTLETVTASASHMPPQPTSVPPPPPPPAPEGGNWWNRYKHWLRKLLKWFKKHSH
ncbi:hypothetical protein K402DRAFT_453576 [Aulographum hederae CBS 113979]|uniref:Uncharacterized protein n=1 Tax=Aulographum hederae CBS 113979 TaxID=1176131 RepID=A0A6G1H2P3_9PEZI|nr:hypothetical protein K402DRAFT_453576 [Aulographum hederae CBS 113979]